MNGIVNPALEPLLRLTVQNADGRKHVVEVVVDTGFNGFLTLPPTLIAQFSLPWLCRQPGQFADGSLQAFDVHVATVDWDGKQRNVEVDAADAQPLLGMALLHGFELRVQAVSGGLVNVSKIP